MAPRDTFVKQPPTAAGSKHGCKDTGTPGGYQRLTGPIQTGLHLNAHQEVRSSQGSELNSPSIAAGRSSDYTGTVEAPIGHADLAEGAR